MKDHLSCSLLLKKVAYARSKTSKANKDFKYKTINKHKEPKFYSYYLSILVYATAKDLENL